MVKDGEIVYPGTELTQSSELPPRKGMFFFFSFYCGESGIWSSYCKKGLVSCHVSTQSASVHILS